MQPIVFHTNDGLSNLFFQVWDQDNRVYVDLSDPLTSVIAKFRAQGTTTVLDTITCAKLAGGSTGWIEMAWPPNALTVAAGLYEIEVSVSFNGVVQTANKYFWHRDDGKTLKVKLVADF